MHQRQSGALPQLLLLSSPSSAAIVQGLIVEPLAKHQIAAAFPLIREALPNFDLAAWTRLARRLTAAHRPANRGVLVARRSNRQHACGLLYYRKEQDLKHGMVLVADHIVALDLIDPKPVAAALIAAVEGLAVKLGCRAIRSVLHGDSGEIAQSLLSAGHRPEGTHLYKTLAPAEDHKSNGQG